MDTSGVKSKLSADLKEAQKSRDQAKILTLRMVLSEIHNQEIDKKQDASDEDVLSVLSKEAKKHEDSIAQFKTGSRDDLVQKEEQELAIIRSYLPAQLGDAELSRIVDEAIIESGAKTASDFGAVMKVLMPKVKNRANGAQVSQMVKEKLS